MNAYRVALDRCAVLSIRKLSSRLCEVAMSNNGKVLLVRVLAVEEGFCLLHGIQHVWLSVLISVSSHSEVDFSWIFVSLESLSHT